MSLKIRQKQDKRTSSISSTGLSGREGGGGAVDEAARAIDQVRKI